MEQTGIIKATFKTAPNYMKGMEFNVYHLFDTMNEYINKPHNLRTAYGWLSENPILVIEVVKGLHCTDMEMAKHFTIKVNNKMYHVYTKIVTKYHVTQLDGTHKAATALDVTKITAVMGR